MKSTAQKNSFVSKYPDIAKEWHPNKNIEYDINNVSAFSNIKVWWLCSKCGNEWHTSVNHRTKEGTGCPVCSKKRSAERKSKYHSMVNNFVEKHPEIAKEWHPTKNGTLKAGDFSAKSGKKVWWKCSFCGNEWENTINHRANGENCPKCNRYQTSFPEQAIFYYVSKIYTDAINRYKVEDVGIEFDIFIPSKNIAIEYDGEYFHKSKLALSRDNAKDLFCKNNGILLFRFRKYELPNTENAIRITYDGKSIDCGIKKLLEIISENHNIKINSQNDRSKIMKNIQQIIVKNSIITQRPELLNEWNFEKNNGLLPESVMANANYKVWWKCAKCGYEWMSTPAHRFSGRGCPACAGNICRTGHNDLLTCAPMLKLEWDYAKNYPLVPETVSKKSNKKVWWKCSKGHEWQASISERNRGEKSTNCPYCCNKKVLEGYNDLMTTNPEIAKQWHPTKNGDLKPNMITAGSKKKIWWICSKGHEWETQVNLRKRGYNCPICNKERYKREDLQKNDE